jgi:transposase
LEWLPAVEEHRLQDLIVAVERTGNYHLPVKRVFAAAGFETRIVHPFATKQFRQPANPGNKTDETDLAAFLVRTPYVLLLSHPGINVVSAAEFAGEAGPIGNYAHHRAMTGRAGLFPARYQSDAVDLADGSLVCCANRSLRAVILLVAANLAKCNPHYRSLVEVWTAQGKPPRHSKVKIASRFCRSAYQIVAGRQVFPHPGCRERDYILEKLLAFHREHQTPPGKLLADLQATIERLPRSAHREEAAPLAAQLQQTRAARRRGPQPLGDLLPLVLARHGASDLQSTARDQDPGSADQARAATPSFLTGANP